MSTNKFEIQINNALSPAANGSASTFFQPRALALPSNIPGAPATLQDLINLVGPNNISINYYASADGNVSQHDCEAQYTLNAYGRLADGTTTGYTALYTTGADAGSGGPVSTGWIPLITNTTSAITTFSTVETCVDNTSGIGCSCRFESFGGWSRVGVSLLIQATVDLVAYCTASGTQNINSDLCYNYMSDYITANGATQEITDYMKAYCAAKYPTQGLSILNQPIQIDPKDYNICACNMNDEYYQTFEQSIKSQFPNLDLGSIRPNCLIPACVTSTFKNNELDNCPIPQCLQIVNINDSNIAGQTTVNQSQNCTQYGITPSSPPGPPSPPSRLVLPVQLHLYLHFGKSINGT